MDSSVATDTDLRRRLRRQEAVADLGQRALDADDLDPLLLDASAAVVDALDADVGWTLELLPGGDALVPRAGVGWREGVVGEVTVSRGRDAPADATLASEEPVVVDDLRSDGRFSDPPVLGDHGVVSGISVRVGPADDPWGVLGTYTTERREFSGEDVAFVRRIGDVLASAVENFRTRQELERSERRYRGLVENFPNGALALVDADLRYVVAGGSPIDDEARTWEDLEGRSVREAITEELAEVLVPRYEAALDGEASTFEYDHGGAHARIHVIPLRDDEGEVFAAMGMSQDVTERKRAERERRTSEERFGTLVEQSPFSIQLFDADGETLDANPAWERLWDASRQGLEDYNVLEDEQLEAAGVLPHIRDAFEGEVVELPETHYDPAEIGKPGRDRWIKGYVYPLISDDEEPDEVAMVHHDVTDRKEREEELARIRERMEFALTATDAVVWDWDVEDDEASFYPSEEPLYGTTVEDWDDFLEVIHPEDRETVRHGIEKALETGEPKHEEVRIVRDGEVRWIEAPGQPIFEDGEPARVIGVARDITERKTYERRLEESNERLEQFAYAASHDLQEPLRMVSSYLQLIESRYAEELDQDGEEFIEIAVDGADRMREMIGSLLAYSRIETQGKPFEPVDLDGVLDAVLTDLEVSVEESGAEVTADGLPRVDGDPDQLRELLQNLLANAIEYSGEGPPRVHVSAERDGADWLVSVSDDGIGIHPDDHDTVFEVFERLHSRGEHAGTGIGLALCDRIVERHGGDLWVDSEQGEGATFHFTLPAARGE